MKIKHNRHDRGGEFVIEENGNRSAEMSYTNTGEDKISMDHTFVENQLRGTGVGKNLVEEGVKFARENNLKILPLCPFVKAVIEKNPEFQDVVAE